LYPARGVTDDYAYGMHGIFCYTFELATEFIPPPAAVQQIVSDNMEAAMILLRRVHHSTLTGLITDSITEEPVVAEIFIDGIDNTGVFRNPYLSNQNFGRYFRMLLPGQYTVQFSAPGYYTSEALAFSIIDLEQTILNYEMIPLNIPEITNIFGGDGFVRLMWELPIAESDIRQDLQRTSEPLGFNLYRNDIHLNPNELITENIYYDYDVINGQSYTYQLTAVYQEGESLLSELVTAIPLEDALISPDNLTISILGDVITIEWALQENALGYHIYSTEDPYAEEWEYLNYTTDAEWSGNIDNSSKLFFRVTAEY
ncbi:MAG: hypothetical protein K0B81_01390, partial [Candidatus Cloacimonetes bacterium]|nr:hypothetical protein [Candidatus Cloacimonadota bacterium]